MKLNQLVLFVVVVSLVIFINSAAPLPIPTHPLSLPPTSISSSTNAMSNRMNAWIDSNIQRMAEWRSRMMKSGKIQQGASTGTHNNLQQQSMPSSSSSSRSSGISRGGGSSEKLESGSLSSAEESTPLLAQDELGQQSAARLGHNGLPEQQATFDNIVAESTAKDPKWFENIQSSSSTPSVTSPPSAAAAANNRWNTLKQGVSDRVSAAHKGASDQWKGMKQGASDRWNQWKTGGGSSISSSSSEISKDLVGVGETGGEEEAMLIAAGGQGELMAGSTAVEAAGAGSVLAPIAAAVAPVVAIGVVGQTLSDDARGNMFDF